MSDKDGQATAVSIVVRIRRFGTTWYRVLFFGARHVRDRVVVDSVDDAQEVDEVVKAHRREE